MTSQTKHMQVEVLPGKSSDFKTTGKTSRITLAASSTLYDLPRTEEKKTQNVSNSHLCLKICTKYIYIYMKHTNKAYLNAVRKLPNDSFFIPLRSSKTAS